MALTQMRRRIARLSIVGIIVVAGVLLSPEIVFRQVERVVANPLLAGGLFLVVYLVRPFFAWPTTAVAVAVGYVYGPVVGVPIAVAGATATACVPFTVARYFRVDTGLFGRLGDSGNRFFDTAGDLRGVVISRLAPAPSDAISAAAGLSNVRMRPFVVGTAIGETPWMVTAVLAGSSLDSLSADELGNSWPLVVAAGLVALFLLAGPAYRFFADGSDG